ncbi:UbiH/UbiF/VisC/COQ6 family ubiquinone biosynthesis hydroxylase [Jannaschia sp. M317]|uniref:UbiH/UbiF/VisC/COQ6 family ubiquinone biosynthesis hydroxylase n=1 Tax=Jannaschia sp. M317 TaxID=2867011 RepID=UPI0021A4452D|nr:UbiH/UbiF/VisC/COQ6 family ubiquinone biosynthesis hydroxylase [Jannaschia sp. M317]UWQ18145.1 UbiH/UbiF/VisC/COQ6 family ubiquinone biosynthesis hydroxylase [Jannaschia sp. M317]
MDTDVIIVGGGLNGPLAALALARIGLRSVVLDARPRATFDEAAFDGRSYAVALGSVRMLQALDLWPALQGTAQPITGIRASDGRAGEGASPLHLAFDAAEIGEAYMGQMIEDRHLRPALLAACDVSDRVDLRFGTAVTGQQVAAGGVTVTLDDGGDVTGALLLGCDGRASGVARRAGIGRNGTDYGQTALVCAVEHEQPHHGIAHQFFMPPGPLAILPLQGDRSSIVWTEDAATAAEVNGLPDAAYLDILRPRFGSFLGDLRLGGARFTYPLTLTLAQSFAAPRLALVGDAAHGIHPIAGQGLNLGFKDIAALSDVLRDARRRGEDIGAMPVLARYQRWRRFDTTAMGLATDAVNRLFSNDNPILRLGRDLGMGAISALPAARRAFMREAAGLTGDLPSLMAP